MLKPSPYTPLTTLKVGGAAEGRVPGRRVNVLAGGDELGAWMTEHTGIDKISFTGSVATGKKVLASAAGTLKRVTLELGGNDPAIILDDVDPKAIAKKVFFASFVNSGQVCMAIKRIYAHEKIYDELCDGARRRGEEDEGRRRPRSRHRARPAAEQDAVRQSRRHHQRHEEDRRQDPDGRRNPARARAISCRRRSSPTSTTTSRLVQEEQFGPIVPIMKFNDLEDAIRRANDTRYGLSGSVWTNDTKRGAEIAARLEVGTAWVNQHRATSAFVPFGGAKESGLGRQYSSLGLKSYMEPEVVSVAKH